jgi:hypothetical protein
MLLNTATSNIMIYDDNNDKISSTATTTQQKQNELTIERIVPLPSVLIGKYMHGSEYKRV